MLPRPPNHVQQAAAASSHRQAFRLPVVDLSGRPVDCQVPQASRDTSDTWNYSPDHEFALSDCSMSSVSSTASITGLNRPMAQDSDDLSLSPRRFFSSITQAKAAVALHSRDQGNASCAVVQNNKQGLILECLEKVERRQACGYRVFFVPMDGGERYQLRTLRGTHACTVDVVPARSMTRQAWFVEYMANQLNDIPPDTRPSHLQANLQNQYSISTNYQTARRVRDRFAQANIAAHNDAFRKLPSYINRLRVNDPQGLYEVEIDRDVVSASFCAPSPAKQAFAFLPCLYSMDGCHSEAVNDYCVLLATARDTQSHIVVLAWGHCLSESQDSWAWFIHRLRRAYPTLDSPGQTMISDRQKGLGNAVNAILPKLNHGYCTQHIEENIKRHHGKPISDMFPPLIYARDADDFNQQLEAIRTVNGDAASYIERFPPSLWSRHAFQTPRFGYTTSNVVKQTNAWLKPHRSKTVIQLFDAIWTWQSGEWVKRTKEANSIDTNIVPRAKEHLVRQNKLSARFTVDISEANDTTIWAKVSTIHPLDVDNAQRSVRLSLDSNMAYCQCSDAIEYLLPCRHIISVCADQRLMPKRFINSLWHTSTLKTAYMARFPIIITDNLAINLDIEPPAMRVGLMRRQAKRCEPSHQPSQASGMRRNDVEGWLY